MPQQPFLAFELPAKLEVALLEVTAQGQGSTDYIGLRATALDLLSRGVLDLGASEVAS